MTGGGLLVVLDVDSTLIGEEVVDLLADQAGVGAEVAAITQAAMRGELDFAASLTRRVALLEGLPTSALDEVRRRLTVTRGVPELIAAVHDAGGRVAAVSGGFTQVLDPLAGALGLDAARANRLEVAGGRLTGRVDGAIVDAGAKRAALLEWAGGATTVAIGDGANDLLMMEAAALSIAFDAKPAVRARADVVLPGRDLSPVLAVLGLRAR
ncbi:phosphoserine phosphatase SerB [Amnibacterium sp. CER49]|uniref:phosphoserine phosphatase SerB n=1 Tax=Amnibacterium sp. CER49 TaxID=3039161 RepID=UPI00244CBA9D|nr:phosphoserine phosphatase SerB [Amnibacterium sp. CER49]MDH2444436.1 phosphoserine phosphatase SerB [Amnibacterium sp. CER49]